MEESNNDQSTQAGRIVVGIDGSEGSVTALRAADRIAGALGQRIVALACWDIPAIPDGYSQIGRNEFEDRAKEDLERTLGKAFGDDRPKDLKAVVRYGSARPLLIEASRDADMLVLGRRGHGGFHGLHLGSVSSACVARAHCPVLVVHTTDTALG